MTTEHHMVHCSDGGKGSGTCFHPVNVTRELSMKSFVPRSQWSWLFSRELNASEIQFLVVDYEKKAVLLLREEMNGLREWRSSPWVLPAYILEEEEEEGFVTTKPDAIEKIWNANFDAAKDPIILRTTWREEETITTDDRIFSIEKAIILMSLSNYEQNSELTGVQFSWVPYDNAIPDIFHACDATRNAARKELTWIQIGRYPRGRLLWQRPNWKSEDLSFARSLENKIGTNVIQALGTERHGDFGLVLRMETNKGKYFLKCSPPIYNDAAFTLKLSQISPSYVRSPIITDIHRQLMITPDYGEILEPINLCKKDRQALTTDLSFRTRQQIV